MTPSEAIDAFIGHAGSDDYQNSLELLGEYCARSDISTLDELTRARLRDFLARWYVERLSANPKAVPAPEALFDTLAIFFRWIDEHVRAGFEAERMQVVSGLVESLPRAVSIYAALSERLSARGGAFAFPEFLASFEEGGRGLYDIDSPGEEGAREGHFRVLRTVEESAEVEDLITDEQIGPVIFPSEVAAIISPDYIMNLEMVRSRSGWQVVGCGFVYPPGTELL